MALVLVQQPGWMLPSCVKEDDLPEAMSRQWTSANAVSSPCELLKPPKRMRY